MEKWCFLSPSRYNSLGVSNPTRNPTNPPELEPKTAQTDHSDGWWWVSAPKTWRRWVKWWVFFSKTRATPPNRHYIQIQQYSGRSKRDLVRSGDIRGDPSEILTMFGEIRWDLRRFGLISTIFGVDLLSFCRFQWIFWRFRRRFGVFLLRSCEFRKNQVTIRCFFCLDLVIFVQIWQRSSEKYRSPSKWNLRQHHRQLQPIWPLIKQLRSNLTCWCLWSVVGFLAGNPMSSGRFWVGHKPDPDQPVDTLTTAQ